MHGAVWSLLDEDQDDELTSSEVLTLASYVAGPPVDAYLVRLAVGDPLPEMPLFLQAERYINVSLDASYRGVSRRADVLAQILERA